MSFDAYLVLEDAVEHYKQELWAAAERIAKRHGRTEVSARDMRSATQMLADVARLEESVAQLSHLVENHEARLTALEANPPHLRKESP